MKETNDPSFTKHDIYTLTTKLGKLAVESPLTKEEWNLLLGIFGAAANHLEVGADKTRGTFPGVDVKGKSPKVDDPAGKDARELRDQLRQAYIPGKTPAPIVYRVTPPPGSLARSQNGDLPIADPGELASCRTREHWSGTPRGLSF
jgi:hypothetical protein